MCSYNSMTACTGRGEDEQLNDGLMFCSSGWMLAGERGRCCGGDMVGSFLSLRYRGERERESSAVKHTNLA